MFPVEKPVVGRAIPITINNCQSLSVLNKGIVPRPELDLHRPSYMLLSAFPFEVRIIDGYVFEENWAAADPDNYPINENHMVDIIEI